MWWPVKSVTGLQQEKPELLFLELSLPSETEENGPNWLQPLPVAQDRKLVFLLDAWALQSLKGASRVNPPALLVFKRFHVMVRWGSLSDSRLLRSDHPRALLENASGEGD